MLGRAIFTRKRTIVELGPGLTGRASFFRTTRRQRSDIFVRHAANRAMPRSIVSEGRDVLRVSSRKGSRKREIRRRDNNEP